MTQKIAGSILYGLWLLTPLITFNVLALGRASRSLRIRGTLAATVFAIPAYLGLICLFTGTAWPSDIFFRTNSSQASISIPDYQIAYAQEWGLDFYETYYEVTSQDGRKAYLEIDGDDNRCREITTQQVGARVYFLCDEKTVTENTSYVDVEQKLLYVGGTGCSCSLDELSFREYQSNPLVSREESGNSELYCH